MAEPGEPQYRVKCVVCGKEFLVDRSDAPVPKHRRKGEAEVAGMPYFPCLGSGIVGYFVGPETKGSG